MKRRTLSVAAAIVFSAICTYAWAEQDFYGIRIKNEHWAKNLVWNAGPAADPTDLQHGPILSQDITAEASLKEVADEKIDFRVTVYNGTSTPINTDFNLRDFFITTRNGQKYPLIDIQDRPELEVIEPKSSAIFAPSLGNLRLRNMDVMLIECSFDLGKTKVFLFPWAQKDTVKKLVSPVAVDEPQKDLSSFRRDGDRSETHSKGEWQTPKRNFWDEAKRKNKKSAKSSPQKIPEPAAQPVYAQEFVYPNTQQSAIQQAPSTHALQSGPVSENRLDSAIKNFVYVPADAAGKIIAAPFEGAASHSSGITIPRTEAHVIGFDKTYNFVTLNLGSRDGLQNHTTVNILRDGKSVAKARVKELREEVSAAALIPETVKTEIMTGDQVSLV